MSMICKANIGVSDPGAEFPSINYSLVVWLFRAADRAEGKKTLDEKCSVCRKGRETSTHDYFSSPTQCSSRFLTAVHSPLCFPCSGLRDAVFRGGGSREEEGGHQHQRNPVAKGESKPSHPVLTQHPLNFPPPHCSNTSRPGEVVRV